ncbi:MAG: hypothetical protein PVS2B2_12870 [Candidatus Acidiferrum sp.]
MGVALRAVTDDCDLLRLNEGKVRVVVVVQVCHDFLSKLPRGYFEALARNAGMVWYGSNLVLNKSSRALLSGILEFFLSAWTSSE